MKKPVMLLASLLLALSTVGLQADRAAADNQDNNSYFGCAVLKPTPASDWSVDHSWWDGLYPDLATGRCMWHNIWTGNQACARMSWFYPGQPGQYFQGTGYDFTSPCWFSAH